MSEYLLSIEQVASLFEYVESQLDETGCDHSRRHTEQWLAMHIPENQHEAVLSEMEDMGGFCDCEVLMNCYEDYEEELYSEEAEQVIAPALQSPVGGSPMIGNGKLVGAVTHVLVNDPTTGYGIYIENMLDAAA